jgi:cysteine desulfurase
MKRIYLDYAAATPVDKKVFKSMKKYFSKDFANSNTLYLEGREMKKVVSQSKKNISNILDCKTSEIIFTSGGTESNFIAISGFLIWLEKNRSEYLGDRKPHLISTRIEHPSVLDLFNALDKEEYDVSFVSVDEDGIVDLEEFRNLLKEETVFISIMYVNSEIGVIQPISEIAKIISKFRRGNKTRFPFFHTDASQAALLLNLNVSELGVDLMTIDAHKIYGPKGVGCLYSREGIGISSPFFDDGREKGLRAGTHNTPGIVGLAKAMEIVQRRKEKDLKYFRKLQRYFLEEIEKIGGIVINGSLERRVPNSLNISVLGKESEFLVIFFDQSGISVSSKSACLSMESEGSYVISAMGKSEDICNSSIRLSFGRETKIADIKQCIKILKEIP